MTRWQVERVAASLTRPLRHQVLRPHLRLDEIGFPGEDDPDRAWFAAFDEPSHIVGVVCVGPEAPPWSPEVTPAWRLRGMATADGWRGRGIGNAVLAAAIDHVGQHGGGLLWCNARLGAVGFYRQGGFDTRGDPWDEPIIGPHIAMARTV